MDIHIDVLKYSISLIVEVGSSSSSDSRSSDRSNSDNSSIDNSSIDSSSIG